MPEATEKIIILTDRPDWAFGIIFENVELSSGELIILNSNDFQTEDALLDELIKRGASLVHFTWRKQINDILRNPSVRRKFEHLREVSRITTHIPDHLYLSPNIYVDTETLINSIDGYFVVNSELHTIYSSKFASKKPMGIIYDIPPVEHSKFIELERANQATLKCIWVGNSEWGKWMNLKDFKGLNSIIKPAIESLQRQGFAIELMVIDASKKKLSHEEVLERINTSDVLLTASYSEGSPLPTVEAALLGKAIVSTQVGTIQEWSGSLQKNFIISRSREAFENAIIKLANDHKLVKLIGDENRLNIQTFKQNRKTGYTDFFTYVLRQDRPKFSKESANIQFRNLMISKVVFYIKSKPLLKNKLLKILHGSKTLTDVTSRVLQPKNIELASYSLIPEADIGSSSLTGQVLAIYNPRWIGLSQSTRSIFKTSIPLPNYLINSSHFLSHSQLSSYVDEIISLEPSSVVISGGDPIEIGIAKLIRKLHPNIQITLLWHGSPANWSDSFEKDLFSSWIELYNARGIDRIDVVDDGLEKFLSNSGIKSKLVMNTPPEISSDHKWQAIEGDDFRQILLAAASNTFRKNYYNQIVAACMLENVNEIKVLGINDLPIGVFDKYPITLLPHVSEGEFAIEIKKSRLVMYATLSECSPMVPLESLAIGCPIVCGPTTPYLRDYDDLRGLIVVKNPDSIQEIVKTTKYILSNLPTFSQLADSFVTNYREYAFSNNSEIYGAPSIRKVLKK